MAGRIVDETLAEIRRDLQKVGQFDLASALVPESTPESGVHRAPKYSRYLIAINGSLTAFAARVRVEVSVEPRGLPG